MTSLQKLQENLALISKPAMDQINEQMEILKSSELNDGQRALLEIYIQVLINQQLDIIKKKKYNNKYYKENIKQIRENHHKRLNNKHQCECGGKYSDVSKCSHIKTNRHQRYLKKNELS